MPDESHLNAPQNPNRDQAVRKEQHLSHGPRRICPPGASPPSGTDCDARHRAPQQTPVVEPPDFEELLQATLKAPFMPKEVFGNLRNLPVPSYAQMSGNILLWNFVAFALNIVFEGSQSPFTQGGGIMMFLRLIAMLIAMSILSFAAAGVLHALAFLSGGKGNYARSFQILSLLSFMAPIAALAKPFPVLNLAPTAYGIYLAIQAVSLMHFAPILQTGIVLGLAGLFTLSGQWLANRQLDQWQRGIEAQTAALEAVTGFNPQMQTPSSQTEPGSPMRQAQQILQMANQMVQQSNPPQVSGLDLVRPSNNEPEKGISSPGSPETGTQQALGQMPSPEQMQKMQRMSFNMLRSIQNAAADPNFFNQMSPQQAATMRQILQISERVTTLYQQRSASGTKAAKLTDAEARQMFQQMQILLQALQQQSPPRNPSDSRP